MEKVKILEVKESIFADNNAEADRIRAELKARKTFLLNLMSSPGAGKTTLLRRLIGDLGGKMKIGVMEADIDSTVDAEAIAEAEAASIQIHTDGMSTQIGRASCRERV